MKHRNVAVAALALASFFIAAPSALAEDVLAGEAPESGTVQWVEGWKAGVEAAKTAGKPMLVYVHRTSPP